MSGLILPPGLGKGAPDPKERALVEKFQAEISAVCVKHKVTPFMCFFHIGDARSEKDYVFCAGNPSVNWMDYGWQRLREFTSKLFTQGMIKN